MPGPKVTDSIFLTRRNLLIGASAVSVFSLVPLTTWASAAGFDVNAFLALSEKQVGQADLSTEVAAAMFKAYLELGKQPALQDLTAGEEDQELSNSLVNAWYTGESPDADALQVLDYTDALIWQTIDYTKPMGYCGGAVGYWADPPES